MTDSKKDVINNKRKQEVFTATVVHYAPSKRRWLMLSIFILFTFVNSLQWGQYIIISNLVQKYYNVIGVDVDWTMVVYMTAYIPLIFPGLWLLEKLGTRLCLIISCGGLCAGIWIKYYGSMSPDRFSYVMLGQSVEAVFQVLAFGFAAKIAALWFGGNEVSFACALAVFGDQLGSALGFLLPGVMVKNTVNTADIGTNLTKLNFIIAVTTTIIFLLSILFFQERPEVPPSAAQAVQQNIRKPSFVMCLLRACKTMDSILMLIGYGINVATFNAYIALLNDGFLQHFSKDYEDHIAYIGCLIMLSGIVGSIMFGYLFDKTRLFKELTLLLYIGSFVSFLGNHFILQRRNLVFTYVSHILIGFFMIGFYSVGIQLAIEITYPTSEGITSSLLLLMSHLLGIPVTKIYRYTYDAHGDLIANMGLCLLLLIGTILIYLVPSKLRRQSAEQNATLQWCPRLENTIT